VFPRRGGTVTILGNFIDFLRVFLISNISLLKNIPCNKWHVIDTIFRCENNTSFLNSRIKIKRI
jgi:hypothetical protein